MLKNFRAYDLAVQLYRNVEKLELKHHTKDQLLRAAQSIVLNLAEGSAKPTPKDKARFYAIAFGSIREVQAVLHLINDNQLTDQADHIAAMVYKLAYRNRTVNRYP